MYCDFKIRQSGTKAIAEYMGKYSHGASLFDIMNRWVNQLSNSNFKVSFEKVSPSDQYGVIRGILEATYFGNHSEKMDTVIISQLSKHIKGVLRIKSLFAVNDFGKEEVEDLIQKDSDWRQTP